jgi:hypothetical protein
MDVRDWFVMASLAFTGIASTVFIFLHPETGNFITWAGVFTTQTGVYHLLVIHDSKQQDAK